MSSIWKSIIHKCSPTVHTSLQPQTNFQCGRVFAPQGQTEWLKYRLLT